MDQTEFHKKRKKQEFKRSSHHPDIKKEKLEGEDGGGGSSVQDYNSYGTNYSSNALKMMGKMGYKSGTGLGKQNQGRVDIVTASDQRGRSGLGLELKAWKTEVVEDWKSERTPSCNESYTWMKPLQENLTDMDNEWYTISKKKDTIEDENLFCAKETILKVIKCKNIFDELSQAELRNARFRSNPYECIRGGIFQNRAAMKMANIDYCFNFMFSSPEGIRNDELLYFADVCAGPGGFSEYALWRRGWKAKGFGFTLKGKQDFKLQDFHSTNSELFEPHYGVGGIDGNGDITDCDNIEAFRSFVMDNTNDEGVYFVTADGGISVTGQENIQEILTKQLVLCQFVTALAILRKGGNFLCKVFDLFTPFNVGLIYLLRGAFEKVAIMKPVTSRPANSERYVVCSGYKDMERELYNYLFTINEEINELKLADPENEINEVIPRETMMKDEAFVKYVTASNTSIANEQCVALSKIHAFVKDRELREDSQQDMKEKCMKLWGIPNTIRKVKSKSHPVKLFKEITRVEGQQRMEIGLLWKHAQLLTPANIESLSEIFQYKFYIAGSQSSSLLISLGRSQVWIWNGQLRRWTEQHAYSLSCEFPRGTILEVEIVQELKGQGKGQHREDVLHVIDAVALADEYVADKSFMERTELIRLFITACHRPTQKRLTTVRMKDVFAFEELPAVFEKLTMKHVRRQNGERPCYQYFNDDYFVANGITFVDICRSPWKMAFSKSTGCKYFFNTETKESIYEANSRPEMFGDYQSCTNRRTFWQWNENTKVHDDQKHIDPSSHQLVTKDYMLSFLTAKKPPSSQPR